jgi:hypothetical protein
LKGKIQAPGYIFAIQSNDQMILGSYRKARFVGAPVPHIDPVKEVKAERMKLGLTGDSLPMTTLEAATEALNSGDSNSNMEQYANELNKSKALKIFEEPITLQPNQDGSSGNGKVKVKKKKKSDSES